MEPSEAAKLIESLLFVAPEPLEIGAIVKTLGVDRAIVETGLATLRDDALTRGLRLQRDGDRLQLVTAPEAAPYVERLLGGEAIARLSPAALETLAIVAYRQPVTRARVEAIRGVNSDRPLATLEARGLIAEVGRLETVGHPVLFGTTFEFLQHFGLRDLSDLPPLPEEAALRLE